MLYGITSPQRSWPCPLTTLKAVVIRLLKHRSLPSAASFWERVTFWLLIVLHLLPVWRYRYFLTADGPTHLYNAWLWKTMLLEPAHPAHQFLTFNSGPEPNYLSHVLLAGLLSIAAPWLAEKLLLTLYVLGLPLALRYALRASPTGADWLALLGFPFIYSVVLLWGFYNFCLSLVLLLLALGYWQRHAGRWQPTTILGLTAVLTLLYFAHPMSYLVSGLLLGLLVVAGSRQRWPARLRELGFLLLAYLPSLPLMGWYIWQQGATTRNPAEHYGENLWNWLRLEPIHYAGSAEGTYRWLVAGLLAGATGLVLRQIPRGRASRQVGPWALGTLLLLTAYVIMPDEVAGGSITRPRWGLLSYLALLGGLAAVPWSPRVRLLGLGLSTIVAAALLSFRVQKLRDFQPGLAEYQSLLPYLRPGSTLLPISYGAANHLPSSLEPGTYISVLSEAVNYLAVERQLLCYGNYEATTGYFPLVWRPGSNPILASAQLPPRLAPITYTTAHLPTYVLLVERTSAPAGSVANAVAVTHYLQHFHFALRYRSPAGLLELYERAGSTAKRETNSR